MLIKGTNKLCQQIMFCMIFFIAVLRHFLVFGTYANSTSHFFCPFVRKVVTTQLARRAPPFCKMILFSVSSSGISGQCIVRDRVSDLVLEPRLVRILGQKSVQKVL